MQYVFVCYAYQSNAILVRPMKSRTDECMVAAYKDIYESLTEKGFKPVLNVTDNECTRAVQNYITSQNVDCQLMEHDNHRVTATERAIQTFKNHFIPRLCSTDRDWPMQLWHTMTEQALITLNLLRTSRIDPTKSAYHQVMGHKYDWNAHPLQGTKEVP